MAFFTGETETLTVWAEGYLEDIPDCSVKDYDYSWSTVVYERLVDREVDMALGIEACHGFLISGPFGSGKHTTARAVAGDLGRRENGAYRFVWIRGDEIETGDTGETSARIAALFELTKKYGNIYFVLDGLENFLQPNLMMGYIASQAKKYEEHAFLAVICEDEKEIHGILRGMLDRVHTSLPNDAQRIRFFQAEFAKANGLPFDSDLNMKMIAVKSSDYNYYQLHELVKLMRLQLKSKIPAEQKSVEQIRYLLRTGSVSLSAKEFYLCVNKVGKAAGKAATNKDNLVSGTTVAAAQTEPLNSLQEETEQSSDTIVSGAKNTNATGSSAMEILNRRKRITSL